MRLPRNVSPAAARRRERLIDITLGVLLAIVVIIAAAGIGVVGFIGLLAALILVASYIASGILGARRRRLDAPRRR